MYKLVQLIQKLRVRPFPPCGGRTGWGVIKSWIKRWTGCNAIIATNLHYNLKSKSAVFHSKLKHNIQTSLELLPSVIVPNVFLSPPHPVLPPQKPGGRDALVIFVLTSLDQKKYFFDWMPAYAGMTERHVC